MSNVLIDSHISIQYDVAEPIPPPTIGEIRRVRRWGDPILVEDADLSTKWLVESGYPDSNFQAVGLYIKGSNQFGMG